MLYTHTLRFTIPLLFYRPPIVYETLSPTNQYTISIPSEGTVPFHWKLVTEFFPSVVRYDIPSRRPVSRISSTHKPYNSLSVQVHRPRGPPHLPSLHPLFRSRHLSGPTPPGHLVKFLKLKSDSLYRLVDFLNPISSLYDTGSKLC